jgi:hypothetical protein
MGDTIMRIKEMKVYPFDELSDESKEKAVAGLWDINAFYGWWESIYEDALSAQLKITEFDIDRGSYCRGEFVKYAKETADAIMEYHGETCETYKTATEYIAESAKLYMKFPVKLDNDGWDDNERDREKAQEELDDEFLKFILEDYRIVLQKEYEYLSSEDAIIETIKANEYEFTEDGALA